MRLIKLSLKRFKTMVWAIPITLFGHTAISASYDAPWVGTDFSGAPCRGSSSGFGPFDYLNRNRLADKLKLVEGAHFDNNVESLRGGAKGKGKNPLPDLDYTLRAFPNHHRALNTAIRYDLTKIQPSRSRSFSPAECYLQRAINFSPKDATTHMLYGILLHRTNNYTDALKEYETAKGLSPSNTQITYNLGLLLVDLKRYEEARSYAVGIYAKGFPLQGLKNQLKEAGHWNEL